MISKARNNIREYEAHQNIINFRVQPRFIIFPLKPLRSILAAYSPKLINNIDNLEPPLNSTNAYRYFVDINWRNILVQVTYKNMFLRCKIRIKIIARKTQNFKLFIV